VGFFCFKKILNKHQAVAGDAYHLLKSL